MNQKNLLKKFSNGLKCVINGILGFIKTFDDDDVEVIAGFVKLQKKMDRLIFFPFFLINPKWFFFTYVVKLFNHLPFNFLAVLALVLVRWPLTG